MLTYRLLSPEPGLYGFQQISGLRADFRFEVTPAGLIEYHVAHEEFLDGRGTTLLTLRGFTVMLDQQLSKCSGFPLSALGIDLPENSTRELNLMPATGYRFQVPSGPLADFQFDLDVNGQILFDPRFADFAEVTDRKLTLNGHRVTIDVRLSDASGLFGLGIELLENSTRELNLMPAPRYRFQVPSGALADFEFDLDVDGQIRFDPRFADFAEVTDGKLTLNGHRVTIDLRYRRML